MTEFRQSFLETSQGPLRCVELAGSGIPMILLHGLGARADRWLPTMRSLTAAGRPLLAFDLPGHGFSVKGQIRFGVGPLADLLGEVVRRKGYAEADVIGTSLGAFIAARFALDQPDAVRSLTLVGALGLQELGQPARAGLAQRMLDRSPGGTRAKLERAVRDPALVTDEWVVVESAINSGPDADTAFRTVADYVLTDLDADLVGDELVRSDLRIALLWGEHDRTVGVEVAHAAAAELSCPLLVLPDTAHMPYVEDPGGFARALLQVIEP